MRSQEFMEFMVMRACTFLSVKTALVCSRWASRALWLNCSSYPYEGLSDFSPFLFGIWKKMLLAIDSLFFGHIKTWNSFFFSTFFCLARSARERFKRQPLFCYVCPHTRKFNGKEKEPEKLSWIVNITIWREFLSKFFLRVYVFF
jgi:hypothetical protein